MPCLKRLLSSLIIFRIAVLAAPAPADESGLLPLILPESARGITASLDSARLINTQGAIDDGDVLDNLQRLLNMIGDHVDKICGFYNDKYKNDDRGTAPAPAPALAPIPTPDPVLFETIPEEQAGHTTTVETGNADGDHADEILLPEIFSGANETSFTNITCKGVSVCNPVTVFNEKGAKRIKWSKIEKAMRKKAEKKTKDWGVRRQRCGCRCGY